MSQPATKSGARGRQLVDLGEAGGTPRSSRSRSGPSVPTHRSGERAWWSTSDEASRTPKCPRPRARAGRPRRPEGEAAASGGPAGCGDAPGLPCHRLLPRPRPRPPPPPPRSAGRPARRREEERAREGRRRGWPPSGPARPPLGRGPAGRGPRSARSASAAPNPGSPDTVPARGDEPHRRWTGRRREPKKRGAEQRRAPPPNSSPPVVGGRPGGRKTDGRRRTRTPRRATARTRARADKPLCRGLTFNRSQRGSCSATYETPTQKQVVYEWFSARFPTNVRCVTGEGAAAFPAAPRFPGRRALRTGPRSRRAAGHAPRGARRPAGGDRRGTGYPRPTEAPRRCRIVPPGRDSDLEAFSHNPTDGSFAPLAPQPSTYTKCLNLRFLSY